MEIVIAILVGISIGFVLSAILFRGDSLGTIRIETSDPDGPYLFLELNTDIRNIARKKNVNFRVRITDSQK